MSPAWSMPPLSEPIAVVMAVSAPLFAMIPTTSIKYPDSGGENRIQRKELPTTKKNSALPSPQGIHAFLIYGMVIKGDPLSATRHYGVACTGAPDDKTKGTGKRWEKGWQ